MIRIENADPSRCELACELLGAGETVCIGDYSVRLTNDKIAEICITTRWAQSNQTKERQDEEISEAKRFIRTTAINLPFLGDKLSALRFSFVILDDYGMGAIALTAPTPPFEIEKA
jgi:hypothetical protein